MWYLQHIHTSHYLHNNLVMLQSSDLLYIHSQHELLLAKIIIMQCNFFYNVNAMSTVHGADPTAGTAVGSAPWIALLTNCGSFQSTSISEELKCIAVTFFHFHQSNIIPQYGILKPTWMGSSGTRRRQK